MSHAVWRCNISPGKSFLLSSLSCDCAHFDLKLCTCMTDDINYSVIVKNILNIDF